MRDNITKETVAKMTYSALNNISILVSDRAEYSEQAHIAEEKYHAAKDALSEQKPYNDMWAYRGRASEITHSLRRKYGVEWMDASPDEIKGIIAEKRANKPAPSQVNCAKVRLCAITFHSAGFFQSDLRI
jgi:hypothetical protein